MSGAPLLDALRSTVSDLVALTANRSARELNHSPQRGEWSVRQIAAHLADAEMVYSVRVRMILTQENPALLEWDEQAWAARLEVCDDNVAASVARFRMLRDANLRLYESLEPEEWSRLGNHEQYGLMSLGKIVEYMIGHDRGHLDEIRKRLP